MTGKKFLFYFFLQAVFFTAIKVWFFKYQVFTNQGAQQAVFWALSAAVAAALCRRLGVINFLEAIFTALAWGVFGMLADLLVTSVFAGIGIFYQPAYWWGWVAIAVSIFLFHKKRHIAVRHELRAQAHAARHGHKR